MEQLTTLPRPGDPGAMEPWALPTWQSWTPGRGGEPGDAAPSVADTPPAALQLRELRAEESSEPKGAGSSGPIRGTDPEEAEACLPSLGQQASSSGPACQRPEDEEVEAFPKAKLNMGFGDRPNLELLRALGELRQRCAILKEENQMLRKSSFPETEEKVRRLKRKNAELAVIAKRLEERARKLQETNLRVVSAPLPRPGASLELCRKALARQRARDLSETASALLAKDKQIAALQRECRELQARLTLVGKEGPQWLHVRDFDRLLRESQREVLRLQRQIALRNQRETPPRPPSRPPGPALPARAEAPAPGAPGEATPQEDADNQPVILGEPEKEQRVQQLESELSKKRKKCESLEQEGRKKQRRCEELELQLREAQNENARLVEENSRLSGRVTEKEQVEWENAELRGQLLGVTQERDSALRKSQGLQSKLESLEQVLKHMREVAQRRQQLEVEHEQARLSLLEKQEEVRRLQQAQAEAKKEHEGAVQLLESTLDSMQARVRELEEQCRSQTEQFSLLAQELQAFRLHPGPLDLLTSALDCGTLGDRPPPPCCCSTPQPCRGSGPKDLDLPPGSPGRCTPKSSEPPPATLTGVPRRTAKKAESLSNSSHSESIHNSPKSCPTPEVDTASEVEELEADSVSLLPATPEGGRGGARIQVFLARYSYNPFEGPNENPEAELPLTAGEYIYVYGNMDEDGFFEVGARAGVVPSQLRVHRLTATSAEITWVPGNSNLAHAIYLNGEECPPASPSTYWATFCHLRPGTPYQAQVEAQLPPQGPWEPGWERLEQRAATLQFTTLPAGPPDAPLDVQIEPGPSPGILIISWLPVTIDAAGTSNGVRVTGYAIYADGQKIMEVASPTAGSVLVELSQLQLLQVCREVVVRTMSPHGESADSIPAPITPALAPASLPARVSCPSPRPSPEARAPLASASPGPGDPSSPLQHPAPLGPQEPPGAPPTSPSREMPKGSHEDPPAPCSQVPCSGRGEQVHAGRGTWAWVLPQCSLFQEEAGAAVLGTSEERTASTSTLGEKDPGPAAPSLAKQEAEWTAGEACPAPSSAQGALAQQAPNTEACQGGDPGSGLRPRAEKEDAAELGVHLVNSLVDHGRNSDLSDIQEEEEEEEEEEELGSRTCSFQKQVAGNSIRENGAKSQPDPFCETDSDEEILEQILELPLQQFCSKKLFSIPEEEEEEEEDEEEEKPGAGCSSQDPGPPEPALLGLGCDSGQLRRPGQCPLSPEPSRAGDCLEDMPGLVGGSSRRRGGGSPEKPPSRRRPPDPREHCSRLLSNNGPQASGRPGPTRERGGLPVIEGPRTGLEASGRGRLGPSRRCSRGRALEPGLASCLSPKCLEISIEYDSEDEQEAGSGGISITSSCYPGDGEAWGTATVGRPRGPPKANSGPKPYPHLPAWEKGEPERRGRSATGKAKEPLSRATETREARGQDNSGRRGPQKRGARVPRPSTAELVPVRSPSEALAYQHLPVRIFVALFDYDPVSMSPNPDAGEEELPFREGQILKVFGDKDADGFYQGEGGGRTGYIPCNMVAEVAVDSPAGRQQLLQRGYLSPDIPLEGSGNGPFVYSTARTTGPPPKPRRSKKAESEGPARPCPGPPKLVPSAELKAPRSMVAAFDYNPQESSPNMDVEAELPFRAGDVITVFGGMDDDGFYYGELNGQRGLVPSNFLEGPGPEAGGLDREPRTPQAESQDWGCTTQGPPGPPGGPCAPSPDSAPRIERGEPQGRSEKVWGFFSKGKQLLRRLGSGKKE
ncbi:peripheral-type benzodiazepine receptor-associated protein 1 isoform X12 [Piliocolobus tephrosceles]|uniref:peripheral-type benzodiazepine receptor-associated protein 1 isoform X12 n=1 Tax=Piliocolobus tephrosceles TaxID=591936 RepID=UPI000E6B4C07|nr:peripheral-type benzodiazepine receptor-associated protein 1 isoform X12 [Piliocolobus tephrosceles]